jgi:hypothetical protein
MVFDLNEPELPARTVFLIQLWVCGRMKNSLEASLEVSLNVIKVEGLCCC